MTNNTNQKIIFSLTGEIHGRGGDPFKWVSYLTKDEREHVRNGTALVVIVDGEAHHYTQSGYKVVIYNGRFQHREPDSEQLKAIKGETK